MATKMAELDAASYRDLRHALHHAVDLLAKQKPHTTLVLKLPPGDHHLDATDAAADASPDKAALHLPQNLRLCGAGRTETTLHAALACGAGSGLARLTLVNDRRGSSASAVEALGASVVLEDCRLVCHSSSKRSAALLVRGTSSSVRIDECTLLSSHAGLIVADGAAASLVGGTIESCGGPAMLLMASARLDACNLTMRACAAGGITVFGRASATLTDCLLAANGASAQAPSISIRPSGELEMKGGSIVDAHGVSVQLAEGASASLDQVLLIRSARAAVAARGGDTSLRMRDCTVSDGTSVGIMLIGCSRNVHLVGCALRANAKAAMQLSQGADPLVEECTISDGLGPGLLALDGARGLLRRNTIKSNRGAGARIEASMTNLEANTILDGGDVGVSISGVGTALAGAAVEDTVDALAAAGMPDTETPMPQLADEPSLSEAYGVGGQLRAAHVPHPAVAADATRLLVSEAGTQAILRGNEIARNALSGIQVRDGACPLISENKLYEGHGSGILCCDGSRGVIRDNELYGHAKTELQMSGARTAPLVQGNRIHSSHAGGVLAFDGAAGVLLCNKMYANARANIRLSECASTHVEGNEVHASREHGIAISSGCCSFVVANDVHANHKANVAIWGEETRPTLQRNRIGKGEQVGVYFYASSGGLLLHNDIFLNRGAGILVCEGASPLVRANMVREGEDAGVVVHKDARCSIECNNIHSNRTYAIAVLAGGAPRVLANWLHGRRQGGVLVDEGGGGSFDKNEIEGNTKSGVMLRGHCDAEFRRNRIHSGRDSGVHATLGAGGLFEENQIYANERAGVAIESGASPLLRRNKIFDGKQSGVFFFEKGLGSMWENEVWGNLEAGIQIIEESDPLLQGNTIRCQARRDADDRPVETPSLWIHLGGRGKLQGNEVCDAGANAVVVGMGAQPQLEANTIRGARKAGVLVQDGGAPTLLDNEICRCHVGIECIDDGEPLARGNRIHSHTMGSLWVHKDGRGTIEDNELYANAKAAVRVWNGGAPLLRGNRIYGGKTVGLLVYENGRGEYYDNEIHSNRQWNVEVKRFAFPIIQRNRIHSSRHGGVYVHGGGGFHQESESVSFQLLDNDIFSNTGVGVSIGVDADPIVKGNQIHSGHTAGILVSGDGARGRVCDNTLNSNSDGVVIRNGGAPTVERNVIRGQTRRGIVVMPQGQGAIVDNEVADSAWANIEVRGRRREARASGLEEERVELAKKKAAYAAAGMLVPLPKDGVVIAGALTDESGATHVTLGGNRVSGGGAGCTEAKGVLDPYVSVLFTDDAKGYIKENSISACAGVGLAIESGADPDAVGNCISKCSVAGVVVRSGGRGRLQNNVVEDGDGVGVRVEAGGEPDARANTVRTNAMQGLLIESGAKGRFSANTVEHNGAAGVELRGDCAPELRQNHVRDNGGSGIVVAGASCEALLLENEISANGAEGLQLRSGADAIIEKNQICDNRSHGVVVGSGARGRLIRNRIERNGATGIFAEIDATPCLRDNLVLQNEMGE